MSLFFSFFLIHRGFGFELLFIQLVWSWRAKVSDVVIGLALPVKRQTPFELVLSSIYSIVCWCFFLVDIHLLWWWCWFLLDVSPLTMLMIDCDGWSRLRGLIARRWPGSWRRRQFLLPLHLLQHGGWGYLLHQYGGTYFMWAPLPTWGHLLHHGGTFYQHEGTSTNMGAPTTIGGFLFQKYQKY